MNAFNKITTSITYSSYFLITYRSDDDTFWKQVEMLSKKGFLKKKKIIINLHANNL